MADGGRRDAILRAAKLEFEVRGRSGARIDRIAADAGVNKQLIFHYFRSKDGLYEAVLGGMLVPISGPTERASTPAESMKAAASAVAAVLATSPGISLALAESAHSQLHSDTPSTMTGTWVADAMAHVGSIVSDGQRHGFFRDDVDVQFVAKVLISALVGGLILDRCLIEDAQRQPMINEQSMSNFATEIGRMLAEYSAWR